MGKLTGKHQFRGEVFPRELEYVRPCRALGCRIADDMLSDERTRSKLRPLGFQH